MGYVDGKTAHQRYQLPQPILDQVEEALGILHATNIVFGDLRHPNIMINKDERVLFIDFDWCGMHEEDTYPVSLNDFRDPANIIINWHPTSREVVEWRKSMILSDLKVWGPNRVGRFVALKKSRVSLRVKRPLLQHEARILLRLQGHAAIPNLYAYGRLEHFEYLSMELLGPSLRDLLKEHCKFSRGSPRG